MRMGTAEVYYGSREEAIRAMESYNGVPLDDKSMNIKIVGDSTATDDGRVRMFRCLGRVVQNDRNNNRYIPATSSRNIATDQGRVSMF